jgi:hypothetical protein
MLSTFQRSGSQPRRGFADSLPAALLASLLMELGAANLFSGRPAAGYALACAGSAILMARLKAAGILTKERVRRLLINVVAVLLTVGFGVQLFTLYRRSGQRGSGGVDAPERAMGLHSGKYRGVILLTEPKQTAVLVAPQPAIKDGNNQSKQPLSIPFDGVYWFFQFPDRQPPKDSYSIHGDPSLTAFRSADSLSIQMEARQSFVNPLDLSCCSRIAVEITNGDRYPGTVWLELILTDMRLPGQPSQSLGRLPVISNPQAAPAHEVLSFAAPSNSGIREFDAVTVRFIRSGRRGLSSAKIAIDRFTLVPRSL